MLAPYHMLRFLSYPEPVWTERDPVFRVLKNRKKVDILDFGCGIAQNSRTLGLGLQGQGVDVHLTLADIPTMMTDFLIYLTKRQGLNATTLECTPLMPLPPLPHCDVIFAQEFFEHVYDPVVYLNSFDQALRPGGFLVTNVMDHEVEMLHVHCDLSDVRIRLQQIGYDEVTPNQLFLKVK
jgi:SAM-dependent methyltransferase